MRWSELPCGLGLVLSLACHPAATPGTNGAIGSAPASLTLQHGTLINPGARPIPDANVVVRDGRIACAGTATACPRPAGSKAIDVSGGYVGPGLIDAHVHYSQTGWVDGRPGGSATFADASGRYRLTFDPAMVDICRSQLVRVTAPGFRARTMILGVGFQSDNVIDLAARR
jgi:hypothetical protein